MTQDIVENSRTTDYKVNGARALCDQEKRAKESPAIITVTLDCSHIQVYVLCGIKSEASHSVCVCVCVCVRVCVCVYHWGQLLMDFSKVIWTLTKQSSKEIIISSPGKR